MNTLYPFFEKKYNETTSTMKNNTEKTLRSQKFYHR